MSVVLPVLNEATDIGRLLSELLTQEGPEGGFEVLVADGGSEDGTREIVERLAQRDPRVRLIGNPARLSSAGRNSGARAARGEYVLFLDGHCELPRGDYLTRMVEIFDSTGADCLCRPQPLDRLSGGQWSEAISRARHSWFGHNPGSDIYASEPGFTDPTSAGAAYRRTCLEQLGGYDERFDACEDVEFNHRVGAGGFRSYRHPDLTVHYRPRADLKGLFRQMMRYGRGRARLMSRHPGVVPWALIGMTLFLLLGAGLFPVLGSWAGVSWFGVAAGVWLIIATVESARLGRSLTERRRILVALFAVHAGLAVGFWSGLPDIPRFRHAPQPSSRLR